MLKVGFDMRIAILTGGCSLERELSFRSGAEAEWAINQLGHDCRTFDTGADNGAEFISDLITYKPDVAFCALLGAPGENGELQGLLEVLKIPYTHSGVLATALAMNKEQSKAIFRDCGLPVPQGKLVHKTDIQTTHQLDVPYVVKPNDDGSSMGGLYLVRDLNSPPPTISETERDIYLVEEFIPGRELTVSVLGDRALAASEFDIGDLYDYTAKYDFTSNNHVLPAPLPENIETQMFGLAVSAHQALGCRGLTRTDFRWDETRGADGLFILELNSQPGFRRDSNSGEHAAYCGIDFPQLCEWLIQDASLKR